MPTMLDRSDCIANIQGHIGEYYAPVPGVAVEDNKFVKDHNFYWILCGDWLDIQEPTHALIGERVQVEWNVPRDAWADRPEHMEICCVVMEDEPSARMPIFHKSSSQFKCDVIAVPKKSAKPNT